MLVVIVLLLVASAQAQTECTIKRDVDKFTDKITIYTPMISGLKASPVVLVKQISKDDTIYYAVFHLYGNSSYGTGCHVIFDDGEKWNKEEVKIETAYFTSGIYLYSAIVMLGLEDVQRLVEHRVTDIKLHDSQIEVKEKNSNNFLCAAKKVILSK